MDMRQALAVSDLGTSKRAYGKRTQGTVSKPQQIAERVYARAAEQGDALEGTPVLWQRAWLQSERFFLLDLPLHFAACPRKATDDNRVQGCLRAAADSQEPIIVDVNKNKVGRSYGGFVPPVIVVDGVHRHAASRLQGRETIKAWVGELAAQALGMLKSRPVKVTPQEESDMAAAADNGHRVIRNLSASSLEKAMLIFGAAGGAGAGMGGPGTSLGQGSGPGPDMVMKPKTSPGNMTMRARKSKKLRARRLKSSGYFGYKDATDTQRQKTKGGSKSEMAKQLKGSGYFGYVDATDKQRQKTKGGSKSEMTSQLKGAADILADASKVNKIWNDCQRAMKGGWKPKMEGKAPPGWEDTVKKMKSHPEISNPWALAWHMKDKGYHPGGGSKKKSMEADVVLSHKNVDIGERPPRVAPPTA